MEPSLKPKNNERQRSGFARADSELPRIAFTACCEYMAASLQNIRREGIICNPRNGVGTNENVFLPAGLAFCTPASNRSEGELARSL